ncbi:hypothetical protein NXW48_08815 [Phocaeicola vulgatus]|nr:hypothetical protein [Phocaeicola vulgatus]
MKKMKLAVVFAAFVSVFGFSSCLDDGESGPAQLQWVVNVNDGSYTGVSFIPRWCSDSEMDNRCGYFNTVWSS